MKPLSSHMQSCTTSSAIRFLMSTTTQPTGRDIWRLVHEEGASMKKAAYVLGLSLGRAYELLAEECSRRETAAHRHAASSSITPLKK
jgi:hypothetical protein